MKIRKLKASEIETIAKLYENEMGLHFSRVGEEKITWKKYGKIIKDNEKTSFMFVLEADEKIIGFLWFKKEAKDFDLEEIFVVRKGNGFGSSLMNFLMNEAKKQGIERINLDVHFGNKKAINFFRKFGFTERTIEMTRDLK